MQHSLSGTAAHCLHSETLGLRPIFWFLLQALGWGAVAGRGTLVVAWVGLTELSVSNVLEHWNRSHLEDYKRNAGTAWKSPPFSGIIFASKQV